MSSALAIASVTAVLKDLLNNGLIDHDVNSIVSGDVTVSALPPDRVESGAATTSSLLNLFLYNVSPNSGWRNVGLPSRDSAGDRVTNRPLAIDLHYLLMAYGKQELDAEILLGYGIQLLHETPVLSRSALRRSLAPPSIVSSSGDIPAPLRELSTSELAEQVEQVKITPQYLSTEDISKLWTAFGAKYRPSAAYLVSVLLIESKLSTRTPLPVQSRNIYVRTFHQPAISGLFSQKAPNDPVTRDGPFLVGQFLVIRGEQLRGDVTLVRISGQEILLDPATTGDREITIEIPDTLRAGVQSVQVIHRIEMGNPPLPHTGVESNASSFVLRPRIDDVDINGARITVKVAPLVEPAQRVRLLLNEIQPPSSVPSMDRPAAYSFALLTPVLTSIPSVPSGPIDSLEFEISGVKPAKYLVRVQIDGAESMPVIGTSGVYDEPFVEVT